MPSARDVQRPQFHLTPRAGWVNDPLALTYHDGGYHLFFQHVPATNSWAPNCHWGHAASQDLISWSERPLALAPGDGDDGCWSGSIAVPDGEAPVLFYTSISVPGMDIGRVRTAIAADPAWDTWVKRDVVAELPPDIDAVTFRDPFVFRDGDKWRMLVGAGLPDGTATALVYVSHDLHAWAYDGQLASRSRHRTSPVWTGTMWECPQLFPLGDRHVLVVSVWDANELHYVAYAIGRYRDGRFTQQSWHRLTYGPCYYAASTFEDDEQRRGLILWLREVRDPGGTWTGALSLPHLLVPEGGRVTAVPHPNLARYRRKSATPAEGSEPPSAPSGAFAADLEWVPDGADAPLFLDTADGRPALEVRVEHDALTVTVSPERASNSWSMPYEGGPVRIILDGPILELFTTSGVLAVAVSHEHGALFPRTSMPRAASPLENPLRWWELCAL